MAADYLGGGDHDGGDHDGGNHGLTRYNNNDSPNCEFVSVFF